MKVRGMDETLLAVAARYKSAFGCRLEYQICEANKKWVKPMVAILNYVFRNSNQDQLHM